MTLKTQHVDLGDVSLCYALSGPKDAPTVCLHHCFASGMGYWDGHMPAFEGFQVLRFDARGHGESSAPLGPYTLNMMANDVLGLLDALEIDRVHFCGVSLGGQIAQTFALANPDRLSSLMLVNTTCEYTDEQVQLWRDRAQQALDHGIAAIHQPLMQRWFTADAAERQLPGYVYMDKAIARFRPESFDAASAAMCMLDTTDRLHEITVPTLVIGAPEDPGAPREITEKMADSIPNAVLEWLSPAHHLSSLEQPARFNQMIRSFLLAQTNGSVS